MQKRFLPLAFLAFLATSLVFGDGHVSKAPEGAKAYFISPLDGEALKGKFKVRFGLSGVGVAPAGVNVAKTGHHHLLINQPPEKLDLNVPLPANQQVLHFGGGQTETELELPPGKHTLQLLLGNYLHIPHDPPIVSEKITVTVK